MRDLLLLHGATGAASQLEALAAILRPFYRLHLFNFPGHGGKAPAGDFSIPGFAASVLEYLAQNNIGRVSIFGYSMGGYVAMYLAAHHPSRVDGVVTLATKFEWRPETAVKEAAMLQPEVIAVKLPAFADTLKRRHAPIDWKEVLDHTAAMLRQLGSHNLLEPGVLRAIHTPVLLMLGEKDQMVSLEETIAVFQQVAGAQMLVLPSTPHPLEKTDPQWLAGHLRRFLGN